MDWAQHKQLSDDWRSQGRAYAAAFNEYLGFDDAGSDTAEAPQSRDVPVDPRAAIAASVMDVVREANSRGAVRALREHFPPAHEPLIEILEERGRHMGPVVMVGPRRALVLARRWDSRMAYLVEEGAVTLVPKIVCAGRSSDRQVLALGTDAGIALTRGWGGEPIQTIAWPQLVDQPGIDAVLREGDSSMADALIPSCDGERVLIVGSYGIVLAWSDGARLLHPSRASIDEMLEDDEEHTESDLVMAHGCMSPDSSLYLVGDQCSDHRVVDAEGIELGSVAPRSAYPNFSAFDSSGAQAIFSSCHFHNGATVGIDTRELRGNELDPWSDDERVILIDEGSRVSAVAIRNDEYLIGDTSGYVHARSTSGEKRWTHFVGSTISGLDVSADGQTLVVGSFSGMVHFIDLDGSTPSEDAIGNAPVCERARVILWHDEPKPLWW